MSSNRRVSAARNGKPGRGGVPNPNYDVLQAATTWSSFQQFYPYYLGLYKSAWARRLNLIGTTISVGRIVRKLLEQIATTIRNRRRSRRHQPQHQTALSPASLPLKISRAVLVTITSLLRGYVLAWLARFVLARISKGDDSTGGEGKILSKHPIWCFLGDIRMWWEVMTYRRIRTMEDLAAYSRLRQDLVEQDSSQRLDKTFVNEATPTEKKAQYIFKLVRDLERVHLWGAKSEADRPYDPGTDLLAKRLYPENVRNGASSWTDRKKSISLGHSKVYEMVRALPKGALNHVHFDAMVPVRILLQWALEDDLICICSNKPILNKESAAVAGSDYGLLLEARTRSEVEAKLRAKQSAVLWDPEYDGEWIPLKFAANSFPFVDEPGLDSSASFYNWLETLLTCSHDDHKLNPTNDLIWKKFTGTFAIASGLVYHLPIFLRYIDYALINFIEDGIYHVEARLLMIKPMMTDGEGMPTVDHLEWCRLIEQQVKKVQASRPNDLITFKVIYTTLRAFEKHQIAIAMDDCLLLKSRFPDLIVGFDLVGHEEDGHNLKYFLSEFLYFKKRQSEEGLDVPLILHAGETVEQNDPFTDAEGVDFNLVDALALGSKRLGHVFALVHHPGWMEEVKRRAITVEICPISNEILRLTGDISNHPVFTLFNHGIPVSLSNDDPSVFSNHGLSPDFFQFLIAQKSHGLLSAKALGYHSLIGSELTPVELSRAKLHFEEKWQDYAAWVVETIGPMVGVLPFAVSMT